MAPSTVHYAAFDRELFTLHRDYRLQVNPSFETQSDVVREAIVERAGERIAVPDGGVDPDSVRTHNAALEWL